MGARAPPVLVLARRIAADLAPGDALVAKASRAMEMERILEAVRRAYAAARGGEG